MVEETKGWSVNKLFKNFVDDILKIEFENYISLLKEKSELYRLLDENKVFDPLIKKAIEDNLLEKQKAQIQIYIQNIDKIERIIRLLKKRNKKLKIDVEEYTFLIKVLEEFVNLIKPGFFKKSFIDIINIQKNALVKGNYKIFIKYYHIEVSKLFKILDLLRKLNLNFNELPNLDYNSLDYDKKQKFLLKAIISLSLLAIAGLCYLFDEGRKYNPSNNYEVNRLNLVNALKYYKEHELSKETNLEDELRQLINVDIIGNYQNSDLAEIKTIVSLFGNDFIKNLNINVILFAEMPRATYSAAHINKNPITSMNVLVINTVLKGPGSKCLHEFMHFIHSNLSKKIVFDAKWVSNGYNYHIGQDEEVAYLGAQIITETYIYNKKGVVYNINHHLSNYNSFSSPLNKAKLLSEYGFFPKSLKISFD